jgi:hypothetical protein
MVAAWASGNWDALTISYGAVAGCDAAAAGCQDPPLISCYQSHRFFSCVKFSECAINYGCLSCL